MLNCIGTYCIPSSSECIICPTVSIHPDKTLHVHAIISASASKLVCQARGVLFWAPFVMILMIILVYYIQTKGALFRYFPSGKTLIAWILGDVFVFGTTINIIQD